MCWKQMKTSKGGEVMERLTEVENGTAMVKGCGSNCKYGFEYCRKEDWENCKTIDDVIDKLAQYETLEEQGLLLRLPCKIGDTIWDNDYGKPCAYTITGFSFGTGEDYIDEPVSLREVVCYYSNYSGSITGSFAVSEIGKTVFLTKAEAEQKLKEMESD